MTDNKLFKTIKEEMHLQDKHVEMALSYIQFLRYQEDTLRLEAKKASDNKGQNKRIPYYDHKRHVWKVDIPEWGTEEGDLLYVAGEYVKSCLIYPYNDSDSLDKSWDKHSHSFDGVLCGLLNDVEGFTIDGLEEYYSAQEQELLRKLQQKLFRDEGDLDLQTLHEKGELSAMALKAFTTQGITDLTQFSEITPEDIMKVRTCGRKTLTEIIVLMKKYGIEFKSED